MAMRDWFGLFAIAFAVVALIIGIRRLRRGPHIVVHDDHDAHEDDHDDEDDRRGGHHLPYAKRCKFKDLHPWWTIGPIRFFIWWWAESGPYMALAFILFVGALICAAIVMSIVVFKSIIMLLASLALFYYLSKCVKKVKTATWLTLDIGGGRLKTTMIEGWRLVLRGLMKETEYSGEQDAIAVEGHADLADGSVQRYKGSFAFIRDRHIVDSHNRPRYPEVHANLMKEKSGLPDRFKQLIEVVMSWCKGDDLLNRDEAVQLALSAKTRLRTPPHMTANGGKSVPAGEIITWYDENKAEVLEQLRRETHSANEVEGQFALAVVETGITFDPDLDLVPAQQGVRKAQLFRRAQRTLEKPDKEGGKPRMSPVESRKAMQLLNGVSQGAIVETGGEGGSGGDPLGFIAGMSILASRLGGAVKPGKPKGKSGDKSEDSEEGDDE